MSQFPRYDEAFILRELVALSQDSPRLVIFSLRPCRDRVIHEQAKALQPQTVYAPFVWSWQVWRSHAHVLQHNLRGYLRALGWIISRHWRHPVILVKTLAFFPKTVHFARLAQQRGVTHVHAFWATYPAAAAMIMRELTGIPFSMSGHAHDIHTINPTLTEKMQHARFVVTCTQANRDYLLSLVNSHGARGGRQGAGTTKTIVEGFSTPPVPRPPSHVMVSYHGVDLSRFAARPKDHGPVCRILAVGSLLPCKGYETLIEGCTRLRERGAAFHVTIAGGGPLERALRQRIAKHALTQQVTMTGFVSQETVAALYQQAHLVILPLVSKIHWGIPNVLIEALATKTPVICCDLPSMRELVVHGESGWIIPENDPNALATSIVTLWKDAALRQRIADAGYQRVVERFSLEETGRKLREIFSQGQGAGDRGQVQTDFPAPRAPRPKVP
ncbi:MAG: glycosyltransferase family 4 protein [Candidatus Omnitrophica bacterium]|nr:glycosyltransferase family 4 protein [Candidatus Omnitrophota bacterium]